MVHKIVTVYENVAKSYYLAVVTDAVRHLRVDPREPFYCLADDFEVSFHRIPQPPVDPVILKRHSLHDLPDEGRRITDIFKKFG